jgi:Uma2 family endonuclease
MGMPELARKWTREMVLALPDDGNRYELFDGELLVTPSPAGLHQVAIAALIRRLLPFVTGQSLGWLMTAPADLHLGGGQLSQPDLFVVPDIPPDREWSHFPNPILVVEVLSPSTASFDRFVKRRRFQKTGIPEYWIVDLDARAVERWRPHDERAELLNERLIWHPAGAGDALDLDLPAFFREVWGKPVT